jgi:hypothetical protein
MLLETIRSSNNQAVSCTIAWALERWSAEALHQSCRPRCSVSLRWHERRTGGDMSVPACSLKGGGWIHSAHDDARSINRSFHTHLRRHLQKRFPTCSIERLRHHQQRRRTRAGIPLAVHREDDARGQQRRGRHSEHNLTVRGHGERVYHRRKGIHPLRARA